MVVASYTEELSDPSSPDAIETPLLVIAGTFVPSFVAPVAYRPLATCTSGRVHVTALCDWGLAHSNRSLDLLENHILGTDRTNPLTVVGHSQGGLMALALANRHPECINRVIALGAPFRGTTRAWTSAPVASIRCMARDSRWLSQMVCSQGVDVHSIFTSGDRVVNPWVSCALPGATNYLVSPDKPMNSSYRWIRGRVSHTTMIRDEAVLQTVKDILRGVDVTVDANLSTVRERERVA